LVESLNNPELAIKLATRAGLPGADHIIEQQYHTYLQNGQYSEAAKIAANSPRGILRTQQTIETFKKAPNAPGTLSPILQYFGILLEKGDLNRYESLELARPVIQQGKKPLLEKWLKENKVCERGWGWKSNTDK
jgi:clathrin heavy chain